MRPTQQNKGQAEATFLGPEFSLEVGQRVASAPPGAGTFQSCLEDDQSWSSGPSLPTSSSGSLPAAVSGKQNVVDS